MTQHTIRKTWVENAALGAMALSVVSLYGVALPVGGQFDAIWRSIRERVFHDSGTILIVPPQQNPTQFQEPAPQETVPQETVANVAKPGAVAILAAFEQMEYGLADIAEGEARVPRLALASIPDDMAVLDDLETRKSVFLRIMLPLVLAVNEEIRADRNRLAALQRNLANRHPLSAADTAWLEDRTREYRMEPPVTIGRLLRHIDIVPPSLALAQAAAESGWGTSRFASEGNALFGQVSSGGHDELVPMRRGGRVVNVKRFASPLEAVAAYVHNLNTHPAYFAFREQRAQRRARGMRLDGASLARTLDGYAAIGSDYTGALRTIMRTNGLDDLDQARLAE
ncbi:MAG: glucosaminidase domain-containing protein [Alphaproteobacteria bacterium]|nr:glucosaminidase domain-containing protein [Alphaproteobacteria bacterium]